MDFLQRVGAEVSLTSRSLNLNHYSFPLTDRESGVSGDQRLASEGHRRLGVGGHEEDDGKIVDDWVGTVELARTVTVSPLSARIAQCRVVTREDPMEINVPRNQVVMVDPECLPGIHVARVVATLEVYDKQSSFTDALGWNPLVGKSPLVVSPKENYVASSDGTKTGMGENHSQVPEGGLRSKGTIPGSDLQRVRSSPPIENKFGTENDIKENYLDSAGDVGQIKMLDSHKNDKRKTRNTRDCLIGFVQIQILNLSLEEVRLNKHT